MTGKRRNKNDIPKGIDLGPSDLDVRTDTASAPPEGGDWRSDADGLPERWEITVAMLAHLLGAFGVFGGVVGGVVGPLVIWLVYQKKSTYIEHHAREAINFQITIVAILAGCFLLTGLTCGLLLPKMLIPVIMQLVFGIIATIAAKSGKLYRYPICLRMLKKEGTDQFSSMR